MITKSALVPLARLAKALKDSTVCFISSCGVHLKRDRPMEVAHPLGDFSFRRVPSDARQSDLIIHQLKYPHDDADVDINVIFPIERLQDLAAEGVIGGLTRNFFSFIGYNTAEIKTDEAVYFKPCLLCLTNTCSSTSCRD
jgi:D-proline reductase (dithiol) PrdB